MANYNYILNPDKNQIYHIYQKNELFSIAEKLCNTVLFIDLNQVINGIPITSQLNLNLYNKCQDCFSKYMELTKQSASSNSNSNSYIKYNPFKPNQPTEYIQFPQYNQYPEYKPPEYNQSTKYEQFNQINQFNNIEYNERPNIDQNQKYNEKKMAQKINYPFPNKYYEHKRKVWQMYYVDTNNGYCYVCNKKIQYLQTRLSQDNTLTCVNCLAQSAVRHPDQMDIDTIHMLF